MSESSVPIQHGFEYEVKLAVSIPITWAILLKQAAQHHYDYKCRESGERGVVNALYNTAHDGEWPSNHPVTWSDLDRVTKIAEQLEHHTQDHVLVRAIRGWLRETMDAIARQRNACMELPVTPTGLQPVSDPRQGARHESSDADAFAKEDPAMTARDIAHLAGAIWGQVEKFSARRLDDGDDVWRERELELRCGVAATANAICTALGLDAATFAAACGLYVSNGRDSYSNCAPGELTWEKPRSEEAP